MNDFVAVVLISGLAFASPLIAERIRLPAVIVEILFGMVLAAIVSNILSFEWFEFLALLGLIFLMFLSGLEIDFSVLEKRRDIFWFSLAYILGSFLISYLATVTLKLHVIYAVFLTNVSLGLVVPVLKEKRMLQTDFGQSILITTFLTDFLTMTLLSGIIIYEKFESVSVEFVLSFGILVLYALSHYLGERLIWRYPKFFARLYEDPMELGVRGAFALMILFSGIAALLGSESILGAFLSGVLVSAVLRGGGSLGEKLGAVGYGIFIPIFFLKAGADLYASISSVDVSFVAALVVFAFLTKIVPSFVFFEKFGVKEGLKVGILQVSKLSLTVAGAEIARSAGIISDSEAANVIFFTLVTGILAPTMFRMVMSK